jgi:hypothetical protein
MPTIPGSVRVGGFIAPSLTSDPYATHDDQYGKGGFRAVADLTARDAITAERRVEGMWVKVLSEDKVYTLSGGITNGDWLEQTMGGGGVALEVDTTYYVDGTTGDDANDGLAWGTAKQTFGFLLSTAVDALPREINATFICNFRNSIRARDINGHLFLTGFHGSGRMDFVGTLTEEETLTITTYENDQAVRHARVWVDDPGKAWTPGEWRRHFLKIGTDYYPIYDNTATKLYIAPTETLVGTPAASICSASEVLTELVTDPGVKYDFSSTGTYFMAVQSCKVPVTFTNMWLDEALPTGNPVTFLDAVDVILTAVSGTQIYSYYLQRGAYLSCYFDLNNYGYLYSLYSVEYASRCAFDSSDETGWGWNPYSHTFLWLLGSVFSRQVFGVYLSDNGSAWFARDMVFRDCGIGIQTAVGTLHLADPFGGVPQLRFDTCETCIAGFGTIEHFDGHETASWDADSDIIFGDTDDAEFSELNARTLQSRTDLSIMYTDVDFAVFARNEYDNSISGLSANRYQTAIDELAAAGGGVNLATFGVLAVDLIDDTDFTAVEVAPYVTEATGYIVEVTPSTGTGNLTVILYDDAARLNVVHTLVIDLSDATTFRSAEAFGMDLETTGTIYGTAFVSGVVPGETFDLLVRAIGLQPSAPPTPLPSPYGQGIEDDGLGKPRIALTASGGLDFDGSDNLVIVPDVTAPVTIALGLGGASVTGAVTTTTDEDIAAKKRFTAVGMDYLAADGPPVAGTYLEGHEVLDLSGVKWRCISAGTPGTWVLVDFVADDVADYVTGSLEPGDSEVVEILTTGDVGFFQHIQIWGVVANPDNYTTEFRVRIYPTSGTYGREMVWQGIGAAHQSYFTDVFPAATQNCGVVDNEDMFNTDEACVIFEDGTRYELARISGRLANTLYLDEILVDPLPWAADTLVCSVAQFDMVPFRNTDGTPANRGRAFFQIRNDHEANEVIFYIRVMPLSTGIIGEGLS